jgi:hypothetical protein
MAPGQRSQFGAIALPSIRIAAQVFNTAPSPALLLEAVVSAGAKIPHLSMPIELFPEAPSEFSPVR